MEDWNNFEARPTFSLFRAASPEDEARKDSFVDAVIYNRWSKPQRRLYQRLKTEHILAQIAEEQLKSLDDIVDSLCQLQMIQSREPEPDPQVEQLIGKLEKMRIQAAGKPVIDEKQSIIEPR